MGWLAGCMHRKTAEEMNTQKQLVAVPNRLQAACFVCRCWHGTKVPLHPTGCNSEVMAGRLMRRLAKASMQLMAGSHSLPDRTVAAAAEIQNPTCSAAMAPGSS
jgi:hypothetical protein